MDKSKHKAFPPSTATMEVAGPEDEGTDQCPSLTTGHQDPDAARYGRTTTEAPKKYVVAVREETTLSSSSSSSTVEFRLLEGPETKAENWTATGSRRMAEEERELKNPVLEKNGPPGVPGVCSNAVPVIRDRSSVKDANRGGNQSRSPVVLCPQKHPSTADARHQPPPAPPSAPSSEPSRAPPPPASASAQRSIGFSVADILDPAKFNGSSGSGEKDAGREPTSAAAAAAAAVAAAGHLVSSPSAAALQSVWNPWLQRLDLHLRNSAKLQNFINGKTLASATIHPHNVACMQGRLYPPKSLKQLSLPFQFSSPS